MSASAIPPQAANTDSKGRSSPYLSSLVQTLEQQSAAERQQIEAVWKNSLQMLNSGLQAIANDALTSTKDGINRRLTAPVKQIESATEHVSKLLAGLEKPLRQAQQQAKEARKATLRTASMAAGVIMAAALIMAAGATWYTKTLGEQIAAMMAQKSDLEAALTSLPMPPITVTGQPGKWVQIDASNIIEFQSRPGKWARLK